jgi:hypothetical protein
LKKRPLLVVCGLVIVLVVVFAIPRLFQSDPNTTFKKEIIEKIGDREVSAVKLIKSSDEETFALRNKEDIHRMLDAMSSVELEKANRHQDAAKDTYSMLILVQGKPTFSVFWDDNNNVQILDSENETHHLYKVKNASALDPIKNYWNHET